MVTDGKWEGHPRRVSIQGVQEDLGTFFSFPSFLRTRDCNNFAGCERSEGADILGIGKEFMNAIAAQCKLENHHPEWSNVSSWRDTTIYERKEAAEMKCRFITGRVLHGLRIGQRV